MAKKVCSMIANNEIMDLKYFIYLLEDFKDDRVFCANLMKLKGILFVLLSRNDSQFAKVAFNTLEKAIKLFKDLNAFQICENLGVA
jgi:hypothetical protein